MGADVIGIISILVAILGVNGATVALITRRVGGDIGELRGDIKGASRRDRRRPGTNSARPRLVWGSESTASTGNSSRRASR